MKRTSFLGVSSKGLVGLHRTIQLQLFSVTGWGIDLAYRDMEWFALETNRDHSVVFETAFWTLLLTITSTTAGRNPSEEME